jgi:hypothetical protein
MQEKDIEIHHTMTVALAHQFRELSVTVAVKSRHFKLETTRY